jgi:hypothetical protein
MVFEIKIHPLKRKIMKTPVSIILGFTFLFNLLFSQTPDFVKLLDENMHYTVDMIQGFDENFIIAGNDQGQSTVFVTSVNTQGEILWSNYFSGEMLWYSRISQKSNGNILIPMRDFFPVVIELNSQGDSVGSFSIIEQKKSYFARVIEFSDSLLFVSQIFFNPDPFFPSVDSSHLIKVSTSGNIIDSYFFNSVDIKDILLNSKGNLFLLESTAGSSYSLIREYNLNGEILSSSSCNSNNPFLSRLFKADATTYYSFGHQGIKASMNASLVGFDVNNQVEFCNGYDDSYFISMTYSLSNGKIYLLGEKNEYCNIKTVKQNGEPMNDLMISDSITGSCIRSFGEYLYIAGINNYVTDPRACFIKLHQDSVPLRIIDNEPSGLKVYPNPTKDYVRVEVQSDFTKASAENSSKYEVGEMWLFDIFGREVARKNITSEQTNVDVSLLPDGVYFYRVVLEEVSYFGKIVVQK